VDEDQACGSRTGELSAELGGAVKLTICDSNTPRWMVIRRIFVLEVFYFAGINHGSGANTPACDLAGDYSHYPFSA